ncbi:hypothetical protein JCM10914A_25050 [Paenibacillus sp. JCM 10914]|uniref:AraC family transcriptional regulator n=1 Tax=Paenibacillus sp. JCM 10914 TaxID=1236974 RepID=UPI0003CC81D4|nr:AraC family transcriptional regulator [Paenibacillus sp. JCM 10914]GAE08993.1 transcriptional regulator, AraC family [Paenibacillus sp. JCM 10914]
MAIHWNEPDIADYTSRGIAYFHSEHEMISGLPCKMYRITEDFGSLSDHMHDYLQIWYVSKGEFIHTLNGKRYRMVQGNLFVLPPYSVHRVEMIPSQELEVLGCEFMPAFIHEKLQNKPTDEQLFDLTFIERFIAPEENVPPKITLTGSSDLAARALLTEMLNEYNTRGPYYHILLKANLLKLLAIINREHDDQIHHLSKSANASILYREPILESIRYIHDHYDQPLRLDDLCARTMMSRTNFCRQFKEMTGRTFSQYVANYRIRMSMRLLSEPDMTVTEVCYKVGFNELPYFCRIFKKYTGTTPAYYKKNAFTPVQ